MILLARLIVKTDVRQVCPDCTDILHQRGMLTKIVETPLPIRNEPPGTHTMAVYRIAPEYTFEQCQGAIKPRHLGEATEW